MKMFKTKKLILITCAGILLAVITIIPFTMCEAQSGRTHPGIYINDMNAGNLTREELLTFLNTSFQEKVKSVVLTLKHKDSSLKLDLSDINVKYDIDTVVNQAYSYGISESMLQKLFENMPFSERNIKIIPLMSYNKEKLRAFVKGFEDNELQKVENAQLIFEDEKVSLRSGKTGEIVNSEKLMEDVEKAIMEFKSTDIKLSVTKVKSEKINIEEIYSRISRDPADAYIRIDNNEVAIVPEITGRSIDKAELTAIANELANVEGAEKLLPVVLKVPNLTAQEINSKLFKDELSTYNTKFFTDTENNRNRRDNIKIAVSKINGTLLAPGETFSFNEVVGERTEEAGFKDALSYIGGKVVPSSGGGICQVSTTLYNAVLPLGLEVEQRKNHMFTVSYVPLGMDAAVAYGLVDFKFKNTTNWPVRIQGKVTGDNKIFFTITGTYEGKNETFEYYSKTLKTTDFKTIYIDEPNLDEGKTEVKHKGSKGYVVDTYKVVKKDGKIISDKKIYTSIYNPLGEEILRGTKKVYYPETPEQ